MKENNGEIFISIFLIIIGLDLLVSGEFSVKGNIIDLSKNNINIYLGGTFILFSVIIIYMSRQGKNSNLKNIKEIEYTKCPTCKETFTYNELEKGKCKNCKDVDTIELAEYYKKYPEEKDNKNQ